MFDALLTIHFIGIGFLLGGSLSAYVLRRSLNAGDEEFNYKAQSHIKPVSVVASAGFALLLISGVVMTLLKWWPGIMKTGLFHAKLTLVVVMIALMGFTHANAGKARRDAANTKARDRATFGLLLMSITTVIIIVLANSIFP